MMGDRQVMQEGLFYEFSIEQHVPQDHPLRVIDRFIDLEDIRLQLKPYYSTMGRPSIDPEPMIRMLIAGDCFGIRSERRLWEEVNLNLAYRWFCKLSLTDQRWSRKFGPAVKMDRMMKEVIQNDKTKEPFARLQSPCCA